MKMMDQQAGREIVKTAQAIFENQADPGVERLKLVNVYGESSKAVHLFDKVAATGKVPIFASVDLPLEITKAYVQMLALLGVAALIFLVFPQSIGKTLACLLLILLAISRLRQLPPADK